jgi:hypothetical protein
LSINSASEDPGSSIPDQVPLEMDSCQTKSGHWRNSRFSPLTGEFTRNPGKNRTEREYEGLQSINSGTLRTAFPFSLSIPERSGPTGHQQE